VLDSLKAQGKIASLQFSFYLTKEEGAQGSLFFIGDPVTEYAPKGARRCGAAVFSRRSPVIAGLHYANVVDLSGMWRVQMDGLAVGRLVESLALGRRGSRAQCAVTQHPVWRLVLGCVRLHGAHRYGHELSADFRRW
jgi:hypothetical protein